MSNPLIFSGATRNRHFDLSGCIFIDIFSKRSNLPLLLHQIFALLCGEILHNTFPFANIRGIVIIWKFWKLFYVLILH